MNSSAHSEVESTFSVEELFFSRTDLKGIILGGNEIFTRVSEYPPEELLSRPHNVIRHPDMPKAVFKLLWDYLKADKSIAAYVKNRSKSGKHYWVFAFASPCQGGYLSIRLKPTSKIFQQIPALYAEMKKFEFRPSGVEDATRFLLEQLHSLGFESYEDFMAAAFLAEMESRDEQLVLKNHQGNLARTSHIGRQLASIQSSYRRVVIISKSIEDFVVSARKVLDQCSQIGFLGINMAAGSERLGSEGRTLNVVSSKFNEWGSLVQQIAERFNTPVQKILTITRTLKFTLASARFIWEAYGEYSCEKYSKDSKSAYLENQKILLIRVQELTNLSLKFATSFSDLIRQVARALEELSSALTAIEIVRLTGKIETSVLTTNQRAVSTHIEDMQKFLKIVQAPMKSMTDSLCLSNEEARHLVPQLSQLSSKVASISGQN